eukprot:m.73942 g.73942  ORF g.73942 m.73942 type:complete len:67 (+) comp8041_c0_seq2:129-329(+)
MSSPPRPQFSDYYWMVDMDAFDRLVMDQLEKEAEILELIDSDEFEDRPSASHTTVRSEELSLLSAF